MPPFSAHFTFLFSLGSAFVGALVCSTALSYNSARVAASQPSPSFNVPREIQVVSPDPTPRTIRVISWNIDRGTHLDTITSELEHSPGDLELFQEVDWNAQRSGELDIAAELASRLHLNLSYGIEFEELSQEQQGKAFIGQATLTRLPIRRSRILRFQTQSSFWKPHAWLPASVPLMQRRLGSRIALVTDLEFAGHLLVVYNAHLESRSAGKIQDAQLNEILADLKQYPPNTAAIIGGDLNTKYFPSTFLKKLEREGFQSSTGERIERSHTIMMALDWIFARGAVAFQSGEVRKTVRGSDHYPVYTQLRAE